LPPRILLKNTFRALRHRDYLIFWSGPFLGHTGTLVQATVQAWLIFQLTDSPFYLGLEGLCLGLPRVLFSALGGAIVDRADRKLILAVTQTAFLLMALFLGVFELSWDDTRMASPADFRRDRFICVVRATCATVDPSPSRAPFRTAECNCALIFNGSALFGPSIGGMLIPYIGTQGCFFAAAIGNLVVLASIFTMRIPKVARRMSPSKLSQDMLEGLSLAWTKALFIIVYTFSDRNLSH
jgi:MFS family permease